MSGQLVGQVTPDPSKSLVFNESHNHSYLWDPDTQCEMGKGKTLQQSSLALRLRICLVCFFFANFSSFVSHSLYFLAFVIQLQLFLRSCFLSSFFYFWPHKFIDFVFPIFFLVFQLIFLF